MNNIPEVNPQRLKNPIPEMTHPLSKSWTQPAISEIKINGEYAVMSQKTLDKIPDYSLSQPSGVYEGKMWKSNKHQFYKEAEDIWYLHWFGVSDKPNCCSHNLRKIIIE